MPARRDLSARVSGRRPKASEEGTRGKAVSGWPSMGIWRGSGFGGRWCCQDRRELEAADDRALTAAAMLDGLMEDWFVTSCRRLQTPG